jgi:hypothetical protein
MNTFEYNDKPETFAHSNQSVSQRTQEMNLRTYKRNIPSQTLQPYLAARPCSTKYSIMPIVDPIKPATVPLIQQPTYNIQQIFNPGNNTAPWSGYASNVNQESCLRNQVYALQSCSQSIYVPSSKSSLYNVKWQNQTQIQQPFQELFKTPQFNSFNPNQQPNKIGYGLFNNATRQQLRDLTPDTKCEKTPNV